MTTNLGGVLWDEGALTRTSAERFAELVGRVAVTAGPRQPALVRALGHSASPLRTQPESVGAALLLLGAEGRRDLFLGVGAPFDAEESAAELCEGWQAASPHLPGAVVVIPATSGPLTVVSMTEAAATYAPAVRSALVETWGLDPTESHLLETPGAASIGLALRGAVGPLAVVCATKASQLSAPTRNPQKRRIGAADTIHVVVRDTDLQVTNRTDLPVRLRIRLGAAGGDVLEQFDLELPARGLISLPDARLGEVAKLAPPQPEMRQWSHEAEVVYEGGERRIHGVTAQFLDADGSALATTSFGHPDSLVSSMVSPEIARALDGSAPTVAGRMERLAARPHWSDVLRELANV